MVKLKARKVQKKQIKKVKKSIPKRSEKKLKKKIKTKTKKIFKTKTKLKIKTKIKIKVKPKLKPKLKTKTKIKLKAKSSVKKILKKKKLIRIKKGVKLERSANNPIIEPRHYSWESKATFNPAAFLAGDKVHIIYRAIGDNDTSVLGYASSHDGYNIDERPTYFVYNRLMGNLPYGRFVAYDSGGGWNGGCEDPRLTLIDGTVYMVYTAFDGWGSLRIALTSIALADFEKKKWNWEKPILISPPNEINKNWVLFPEKINGKFAILHNITPEILVEYVESLKDFDGTKFIKSRAPDGGRHDSWDNWVRGVGPSPIKTNLGWLVLYHAMDSADPDRYKLGAMILDLKDPTKVLYRSSSPILEPDEHYENQGWKSGVVYSCGAVVKDGDLLVYYGGADKVACVASIKLSELLEDLKKNKVIKLKSNKPMKI